jgi:Sulfatase
MSNVLEKLRINAWHTYLIALYFVLKNAVDIHLPIIQWVEPLSIFIILYALISILLFILKKTPFDKTQISILITSALGILFFLLPIFSTLNFFYPSVFERVRQALLFSFVIWFIFSVSILLNREKSFLGFNYYLNILLITFCLWDIGRGFYETIISTKETFSKVKKTKLEPKHSIYLIVPDGYASSKSLKKYWQYDNAEFDNYLTQKGFFMPQSTHSNYKYTVLTMGSCLNMSYFTSRSEPYIASQVKRNEVCKILDNMNYDCFMLDFTGKYYKYDAQKTKVEYKLLLFMQSAAYLLCRSLGIEVVMESYITNTKFFNLFKSYVEPSKKQFIYMHSMITHPPFYDESEKSVEKNDTNLRRILGKIKGDNWLFRNNEWRTTGSPQDDAYLKQIYLSKIKYTNQQIQNSLDTIWNTLKNNIVIVMSDHGFRELPGAKKDALLETYSNYCAIYFPDKNYSTLTDSITPINVMRMAINKAINTQLQYLPDKTNL